MLPMLDTDNINDFTNGGRSAGETGRRRRRRGDTSRPVEQTAERKSVTSLANIELY